MNKPVHITIPTPCQENWKEMTPVEKGRFCGSCQKVVRDFRKSSDKEIRDVYLKDADTCGHFTRSQLNRDLIVSSKPNTIWVAAGAAVISFVTVGMHEAFSQTLNHTEQFQEKLIVRDSVSTTPTLTIQGVVRDKQELLIPGVSILNVNTGIVTSTDNDGRFSIEASFNDIIDCSFIGYTNHTFIVDRDSYSIQLTPDEAFINMVVDVYGRPDLKRPTFFGRIFHSIGNLFR